MVVRTSIGGDRLRLQFANALDLEPVLLGAVHVARHRGNGSIDRASDRAVTFGGKPSVTVRPGALVISDPVDLASPALTELAVSVYLPGPTNTGGRHELGLNTTYIVPGNAVGKASLADNNTNRSYFWLTGIETAAAADATTIVAFGDSITDGFATTADRHQAWPAQLAQRLQNNPGTGHLGVINMGISGNRVLRKRAGASALTRFDRDVLARQGVSWIILLEGINDITWSALPGVPAGEQASAEAIIEGLSQLVARAHAHGIRVMGATLTPMGGLWLFNEDTEAMRQAVNDWIRHSGTFDAVVDFDAVTRDPRQPAQLRPGYDSGDHIHPNDAGNAAMAGAIDPGILQH
jgi:lysophospholipase L1-like esterase